MSLTFYSAQVSVTWLACLKRWSPFTKWWTRDHRLSRKPASVRYPTMDISFFLNQFSILVHTLTKWKWTSLLGHTVVLRIRITLDFIFTSIWILIPDIQIWGGGRDFLENEFPCYFSLPPNLLFKSSILGPNSFNMGRICILTLTYGYVNMILILIIILLLGVR